MATSVAQHDVNARQARFTDEQRSAVHARGVSVALSAGAGCGKTFVLTERYLSELEPGVDGEFPCDLSDLVAITFTDRAAREMRDRIRAKCFERLQQAPPAQGDYWLKLLRSLDSARVSTIHAFCATLLRTYAVEAELDPCFAVLEAAQAETLLAELVDDLLRDKLTSRDAETLDLVVIYGLARLRTALADLMERSRGCDPTAWLAKTPAQIVAVWQDFHAAHLVPQLLRDFGESAPVAQLLNALREIVFASDTMCARRDALLKLVPGIVSSPDPAADLLLIHENARVAGSTKTDRSDGDLYETVKQAAEKVRKQIEKLVSSLEFDGDRALSAAQIGLALLRLAAELAEGYQRAKEELAVLDFDDLLLRARRLLTDDKHQALRQRLAADTRLLLVDECQDTDPVQVELIKALCGDNYQAGKLFFVGDVKQSIYRFRGADPRVFRRLRHDTPESGQLPLSQNFRSQPEILHFVNALFYEALGGDGSGAGRLPYEALVPHREQTYGGPAIEFMWCIADHSATAGHVTHTDQDSAAHEPANGVTPESAGADALRRREADWIACRICQLIGVESGDGRPELRVYDKSSKDSRPVRQGDIAILFRSLSDVSFYEEALRRYKIDYYLVGGHAFYAQQEIYDVVNLLRSLVSPADEVSLAGVLRSPFFSLSDETLFWLAEQNRGLWTALCADSLSPNIDEPQRQRVKFAAHVLMDLKARKDRVPIAALINDALHYTGYDAALLGEFLGERKLANLRKLIDQARDFDRAGVMGLSDFIVQLSQFVVRQPREALAATHAETTDVVRLMTIHQSKGLEFPVVFVPDLGRQLNSRLDDADYCDELGPLARLPDDHEHAGALNGHRLYAIARAAEDRDEAIRLLYVATTRAADFLVLSSGMKKLDQPCGVWMQLLAERFDLANGRLLASLPDGYTEPRVAVVTEPPRVDVKRGAAHPRVDLDQILREIDRAAAEQTGQSDVSADPIPCDAAARRRFSVSRLHGHLEENAPSDVAPESSDLPDIMGQYASADPQVRDAIALGTLVHAALATLGLSRPSGDVAAHVAIHADKLRIGDAALRQEAIRLVERFIDSPRAAELRHARQALKEIEFLLAWPPLVANVQLRLPMTEMSGGRYLQGYLDCLYQDKAGRWCVMDYKTNQVSPGTLAELVARYEMQMLAYGLAAEQSLGEPITEIVLHFLRTGDEHKFAWDDKARRRAVELVDRAIEALCCNPPESKL